MYIDDQLSLFSLSLKRTFKGDFTVTVLYLVEGVRCLFSLFEAETAYTELRPTSPG